MKHPWSSQHFTADARLRGTPARVIDAANARAALIKRANPDIPVVLTLKHLAVLVDVPLETLREIVNRESDPYRVFRVKKKRGSTTRRSYRTICVPIPVLMRVQRWIAQNILNAVAVHDASFAYAPNRDMTGAADRHTGCKWLLKIDVENFFENITERQIFSVFRSLGYSALVSFELARLCTRVSREGRKVEGREPSDAAKKFPYWFGQQGHLPQGAPTSPMLANLAVRELDHSLSGIARKANWTYTRYADDLAFSTANASTRRKALKLADRVKQELEMFGLAVNAHKTTLAPPGARKLLLGILVDRDRPRLTKSFRNNLETHIYALKHPQIGPAAHRKKRGFASTIGMMRHIMGLLAFAHQVDPDYARSLYTRFNAVDWEA